jgi:hypothetical protein
MINMKKIIRNDYSTNISVFEVEISDEDVLLFTEDRDKFFNEVLPNLKFNFIKNNPGMPKGMIFIIHRLYFQVF